MIETILALVPTYGLLLVALGTFLSCLALPVPSSLIMLSTKARFSSLTLAVPLRMRDTVLGDTPARSATMPRVGRPRCTGCTGRSLRTVVPPLGLVGWEFLFMQTKSTIRCSDFALNPRSH